MRASLILLVLALGACGAAPPPEQRRCFHTGGMEVKTCTYTLDELEGVPGEQGIRVWGWLEEDGGTLYLSDREGVRVRIARVVDPEFVSIRGQMIGRYLHVYGLYDGKSQSIEAYSTRWGRQPDGVMPPPLENTACHHFGGMDVQACEYTVAELAEIADEQGVMLLGWLQEDGEALYIVDDDDGTRVRVDAVRYEGFDEFRNRLIDRYVRVTGMYLPKTGGLDLVSIRLQPQPDGGEAPTPE